MLVCRPSFVSIRIWLSDLCGRRDNRPENPANAGRTLEHSYDDGSLGPRPAGEAERTGEQDAKPVCPVTLWHFLWQRRTPANPYLIRLCGLLRHGGCGKFVAKQIFSSANAKRKTLDPYESSVFCWWSIGDSNLENDKKYMTVAVFRQRVYQLHYLWKYDE